MSHVTGPGRRRFVVTDHARGRWAERCPHIDLTTIEHAVRFSRFLGEQNDPREPRKVIAWLYYAPERLLFVCKRDKRRVKGQPYFVATVYPNKHRYVRHDPA